MTQRTARGTGLSTVTVDGTTLDAWYPRPVLDPDDGPDPDETAFQSGLEAELAALAGVDEARGVRTVVVSTVVDLDAPPQDTADAYLRLHLLSHRLVAPHGQNLEGIFGVLPNVVWTDRGPCPVEGFETTRRRLLARDGVLPTVHGVDKFPRMVDYVVPSGVRIADGDRVRLGAHLADGTTVMHEGFVNFNAGTLGTSMIEGRVSAGVVIGVGSDVGGGASIMGTLSGGGRITNSVGRRSLLGANAGLGFPLGDDCVVEAGLYVTAGTKVTVVPGTFDGADALAGRDVVKGGELSGLPGLLLRRNSVSGAVEVLRRPGTGVDLNPALHAN